MKKVYEHPQVIVQEFTPNEYVAACVTGTIQCMYPGNGKTNGQEIYDDYNGKESGYYTDSNGMLHGLCGYDAPISFDSVNASGFETKNGVIQKNRPIYNIKGYELLEGTYTVTWNSNDGNGEYYHEGRLKVTNIDNDHPNHS